MPFSAWATSHSGLSRPARVPSATGARLHQPGRPSGRAEPGRRGRDDQESLEISEKLATEFPANIDCQIELGRCLTTLGAHLAAANRVDQAESFYTRGLAVLNFKDKAAHTTESLRQQATVLSNLLGSLVNLGPGRVP